MQARSQNVWEPPVSVSLHARLDTRREPATYRAHTRCVEIFEETDHSHLRSPSLVASPNHRVELLLDPCQDFGLRLEHGNKWFVQPLHQLRHGGEYPCPISKLRATVRCAHEANTLCRLEHLSVVILGAVLGTEQHLCSVNTMHTIEPSMLLWTYIFYDQASEAVGHE